MSDTLASLRHKLEGAGKIKSVVRTMKVLAASSISQYESAVRALAGYERALNLGLGVCLRQGGPIAPPPNRKQKEGQVLAVVFGSDQGLVGQFNEVVCGFAMKTLNGLPGDKRVWSMGERVNASLVDGGFSTEGTFDVPNSVAAITPLVGEIQLAIEAHRGENKFTPVYLFYNQPQAGVFYQPVAQRLLPLDVEWQRNLARTKWPTQTWPDILGSCEGTVGSLVREYLFISLYKASAESLASENASRLAAMQRAEKNIDELVTRLIQSFQRLRQNSIDEELFDVVAGYKSLME